MAKVIVTESYLNDIGDAIRSKLGGSDTYKPSEMAGAISQIHGEPVLEALSVTENGTYDPSSGKDGFSQAIVNVPNSYAAGDEGKVVSNGALVAQTSDTVTENDTYDTTLINQLTVNVGGGGGGGAPIFSGTSAPTSDIGSDEDLYIHYENMSSLFDYDIGIVKIYRKVNGAWVDYTQPELPTKGVHIWTQSTGGFDAAMYVQEGYWDDSQQQFVTTGSAVTVIYTSVQSSTYDCNGIATLNYSSGWRVYATDSITDGTNDYNNGDLVKNWQYNVNADFYIWRDV